MNTHKNPIFLSRSAGILPLNMSTKHVKRAGFVIAIIVIGAVLYFGQQLRVSWREQNAQYAYAHIQDLLAAQEKDPASVQLDSLITQVDETYSQHASSYLAPYFLNLKAEALLLQGNKQEALQVMSEVIKKVDHTVLGDLARTKHALLQLDIGDAQEAISQLEQLSTSAHNQVKDIAQFYLGRYYWVNGQNDQAKQVWNELIEQQRVHRISPSPWAQQASQYIEYVS